MRPVVLNGNLYLIVIDQNVYGPDRVGRELLILTATLEKSLLTPPPRRPRNGPGQSSFCRPPGVVGSLSFSAFGAVLQPTKTDASDRTLERKLRNDPSLLEPL